MITVGDILEQDDLIIGASGRATSLRDEKILLAAIGRIDQSAFG